MSGCALRFNRWRVFSRSHTPCRPQLAPCLNGTFLIRVSESTQSGYALSVVWGGATRHFRISTVHKAGVLPQYVVAGAGRHHNSLRELVHYYSRHALSIDSVTLNAPFSTSTERRAAYSYDSLCSARC